jgi:hypothetical protein
MPASRFLRVQLDTPASRLPLVADRSEGSEDRLLSALTTEHSTLQAARAVSISEGSSRVQIFLTTLSTLLVAIAFVGQATDFGTPFYTFALTILPAMLVVGFATFRRVLQTQLDDAYYALAISRIREHYKTLHPDAESLMILPTTTGLPAIRVESALEKGLPLLQPLFMISGMVAFVEALVAGAFVALAINRVFDDAGVWAVASGIVVAMAAVAVSFFYVRTYVWGALAKLGVSPPWKEKRVAGN